MWTLYADFCVLCMNDDTVEDLELQTQVIAIEAITDTPVCSCSTSLISLLYRCCCEYDGCTIAVIDVEV